MARKQVIFARRRPQTIKKADASGCDSPNERDARIAGDGAQPGRVRRCGAL